ncbi:hypothetical protein [Halovenus sp. HT40]|uniref:hypothetical protein n=1 Tax=Halovenus sp. HT40 TaxID=3126691 RepID=UPI00300E995D
MHRRTYLIAAGSSLSALLAGCVSDSDGDDPDENSTDQSNGNGDEQNDEPTTSDEHPALTVADQYVQAAMEEDLDGLSEYMHSKHPFNPAELDDEQRENVEFEFPDSTEYERELIDEFDGEDLRDKRSSATWFGEDSETLTEITDGEQAALVEISWETDDETAGTPRRQFFMLTEGSEWRVFLPHEQSREFPDKATASEEYQIVDRIEYDTETERAKVYVSGTKDIEAEEVVVYSERLGEQNRLWSQDSETLPSVNYLTAGFDSSGDELVVTVLIDDEEHIVYRDKYRPE